VSDGVGGVLVVALAAIVPLVVLMLTSFVKVSVVLALLRNALGSGDAPSSLVVMGISLVLTFFVMAPVAIDMIDAASTAPAPVPTDPVPDPRPPSPAPTAPAPGASAGRSTDIEQAIRRLVPASYREDVDAAGRALGPLRRFMQKYADEQDRATFVGLAGDMGRAATGDEVWVLAPAFLATELREAFAIAVLIFIPFLVLDLVVGLGLASLGLSTTQPQTLALPLKLLLFVAVDGWRLLLDGLLRGYV
jgi:type III secretion protein R